MSVFVHREMAMKNELSRRYCINCHVRVTVMRSKGHNLTGVLLDHYENVARTFVHPASSKQLYADAVCTDCARAVYKKKRTCSVINIMHSTFIHALMLAHIHAYVYVYAQHYLFIIYCTHTTFTCMCMHISNVNHL